MALVKCDGTRAALGSLPSGSEMMAWEVLFGDSRRPMAIGNLLANDIGRIATGCSNSFVRLLTQDLGEDEFHVTLRALRERITMMEAVAMLVCETRRAGQGPP